MLGGALGAGARYLLVAWSSRALGAASSGVLMANVVGSLLIGVILGWAIARGQAAPDAVSPKLTAFLTMGVLGGFTTFSTFSMDALRLIESGRLGTAALYMGGSLFGGLAAAALGLALGRMAAG